MSEPVDAGEPTGPGRTEGHEEGSRRWPAMGVVLAVLWLFVRGVYLDPMNVLGEFLIGLAVGMPIAFLLRRMYPQGIRWRQAVTACPPAAIYVALFLKELITANLDVAWRVLSPSMPLDPAVIELPLRVESDAAVTTIANSITLTPGTLTMDYDEERNALYVHAIYCPDPDAVVAPIRDWEDYALRIFDEPAAADDPAPEPTIHEEAGEFDGVIDETGEEVETVVGDEDGPERTADATGNDPEETTDTVGTDHSEDADPSGGETGPRDDGGPTDGGDDDGE